jgi:alpha-amylase
MTDICMGFEVHQPLRVNRGFRKDLAKGKSSEELLDIYFDNEWNRSILKRVANKCYLPTNRLILELIDQFKSERKNFKVAYSISGVLVEQCERWAPDALDLFKQLAESAHVEFLDQTYFHSLSSLFSATREDFVEQVLAHRNLMEDLFNQKPNVFENTEFIYNNSIARTIEGLGYKSMFTEGAEKILGWRSPNYVYKARDSKLKVLLRNYRLSDDIAFKFSDRGWKQWPLTADKYSTWLSATPGNCINIFIDYETFGEHQWAETGIFEFLRWLPEEVLKYDNLHFATPSELLSHEPVGEIYVHDYNTISWADSERSTNAWLGNNMQRTCYEAIRRLEPLVKSAGNPHLLKMWRLLQMSDNIYYMYSEPGASGMVHGYFSQQYPADAFRTFANILSDFQEKVAAHLCRNERTAAYSLRLLPPEKAFYFYDGENYLNLSAHSLLEFGKVLKMVPEHSVYFHMLRHDFERWIRFSVRDSELADRVKELRSRPRELRQKLQEEVDRRCKELTSAIGRK